MIWLSACTPLRRQTRLFFSLQAEYQSDLVCYCLVHIYPFSRGVSFQFPRQSHSEWCVGLIFDPFLLKNAVFPREPFSRFKVIHLEFPLFLFLVWSFLVQSCFPSVTHTAAVLGGKLKRRSKDWTQQSLPLLLLLETWEFHQRWPVCSVVYFTVLLCTLL